MLIEEIRDRHLPWDACYNIRDVGGYPTLDGGTVRWHALVRADNLCRLTAAGCQTLLDYGIRTIIDLRLPVELEQDPNPFAQTSVAQGVLSYQHRSLLDPADIAGLAELDAAPSQAVLYQLILERFRDPIRTVIMAIAEAQPGGILIHCHAGKDRTGLVTALLLGIAGVPDDVIIADYALTERYLRPLHDRILERTTDPIARARLAEQLSATPTTMRTVLDDLNVRYGGIPGYLAEIGVSVATQAQLRAWLQEPTGAT